MAKIGIITPPVTGHLNPTLVIGKELKARGHEVIFFNIQDVEEKVVAEGLGFQAVGQGLLPKGIIKNLQSELGNLHGLAAMRCWSEHNRKLIQVMCLSLPKVVKAAGVDFLLVDQSDAVGGSVAEALAIPYATLAIGLNLSWEEELPPPFMAWKYEVSGSAVKRNRLGMQTILQHFSPVLDTVNKFRKSWKLQPYESMKDVFPVSSLAQIAQMPAFLDYPRKEQPACFHYTGPFRGEAVQVGFPFERLNGKPLVYISLGTVVNNKPEVFKSIARAFGEYDVQLVISLGTDRVPESFSAFDDDTLVVPFAPQYEVLKRASLCVTHAGLNTVMDALENGVPLIALPISFDQPATAGRLQWHGLGEVLSFGQFNEQSLAQAIAKVFGESAYKTKVAEAQKRLKALSGVKTAADIIEEALHTKAPVVAGETIDF